jgi:hypothetical protein
MVIDPTLFKILKGHNGISKNKKALKSIKIPRLVEVSSGHLRETLGPPL